MSRPERRTYPRYLITLDVRGWVYDGRSKLHAFSGQTMNVGRDGIALLCYDTPKRIQRLLSLWSRNQPVHVELALPPDGAKITASGRARWYEAGSTTGSREYLIAGIRFGQMLPQAQRQWEQFIQGRARGSVVEMAS